MPGEGLQIPVDFTLEEARAALKQLEEAARQAGRQMQTGLAPATKEVQSFGSMLTQVARSQRGEGRIAAFYVQELSAILPITGAARMAVGELTQAFVGGAGLGAAVGLAFGSLKVGASLIKSMAEEGQAAIAAADAVVQPIMKSWADRVAALNRELVTLRGGAVAGIGYDLAQARRDLTLQIFELERQKRAALLPSSAVDIQGRINKLQQELQDLTKTAARAVAKTEEEERTKAEQDKAKADKAAADARTAAAVKAGRDRAEAAARAEAEEYVKRLAFYARGGSYLPQLAIQEATNSAADQRGRGTAGDAALTKGDREAMEAIARQVENAKVREAAERAHAQAQEQEREQLRQTMASWQQYGETVGNAIGGVIAGTRTWGQVFGMVMQQMALAAYQNAVRSIMASAGKGAAETAAQNASLGPWGWITGLASAGVVFAAIQGFIGKMGSAANGAVLPTSGGPFPFLLHPQEWVLPAEKSRGLDNLIQGGAPAAARVVNVSITVPSIDGDGVRRFVRSAEFRKAIADATRDGRG